ncbi:unnamed protein product [Enterobius vermicularis]|uniref:PLCXc domain-containing protein n=1 Tax=Enterobius vermicularis TaxID=51028 RepID=A0A0N4UZ11_ENTVE|nr:unnamed protein product [Enterobius vermicularis]
MADWMSKLPVAARERPLMNLAIPGSHHSGTCELNEESEITMDQPWCVRALTSNDTVRKAVYNWSKDQSLNILQQLEAGIRYLDVTVVAAVDNIFVAHGLYCMPIRELLRKVDEFTTAHPKEVVLIDINRFYQFNEFQHAKLLELLDAVFGKKLISRPSSAQNILSYTLNKIWEDGGQVIVFYRPNKLVLPRKDKDNDATISEPPQIPKYIWSNEFIRNPWPRTEEPEKMIEEVQEIFKKRNLDDGFQVCQAIVTLTLNAVIRQPLGTFETRYARRTTRALVRWLRKHGYEYRSNINIISTDFVDEEQFCETVIDLNN